MSDAKIIVLLSSLFIGKKISFGVNFNFVVDVYSVFSMEFKIWSFNTHNLLLVDWHICWPDKLCVILEVMNCTPEFVFQCSQRWPQTSWQRGQSCRMCSIIWIFASHVQSGAHAATRGDTGMLATGCVPCVIWGGGMFLTWKLPYMMVSCWLVWIKSR